MKMKRFDVGAAIAGGRRNFIRDLWDRCAPLPGGHRLFSRVIGWAVPYTATIHPEVVVLTRGRSEVLLKDRRRFRNHLNSLHAIALANLAELAGNLALAYSMPDDARFIVSRIDVEYLKKARGTIRAVCTCPVPESSERREYEVAVSLRDLQGEEVARTRLTTLIGPKPA